MSTTDDLPTPVWSGSFKLFGVDVRCHTLSTGERIIEQDSVLQLFQAMGMSGGKLDADNAEAADAFARWQRGA